MASHTSPLSPTPIAIDETSLDHPGGSEDRTARRGRNYDSAGYVLRVVQGAKCRYTAGLFSEFATAMDFPTTSATTGMPSKNV